LNREAEAAAARVARGKPIEAAESADVEPPDLEPLAAKAMPRPGQASKADGTPTKKNQRNHRWAEGSAYTDCDSHIMKSDDNLLQGHNCPAPPTTSKAVIDRGLMPQLLFCQRNRGLAACFAARAYRANLVR
jgi:hypothetical protein